MRIIHIIPSLTKGGAERLVIDICTQLNKSNIPCLLVVLSAKNDYQPFTKNLPIVCCKSYVHLSVWKPNKADIEEFKRIIDEFKPTVIHSHLFEAEILSRYLVYPNIKYFSHLHDNMPQLRNLSTSTFRHKKYFTDFYEKHFLNARYSRCSNTFIAISQHALEYIHEVLGQYPAYLLHNSINRERFVPRYNIAYKQKECYQLVSIGSFQAKKAQSFAIEVLAVLRARGINAKLSLVGDGMMRHELEELTKRLDLTKYVLFHGLQNHPEHFLWASDLYVHTATYEPFGLVLIEAMASGLPIVCTDAGGNRDLIENGKNGFILPNRSPKEFADKVEWLLTHPKERENMGQYAQEFSKKYDIEAYVDKLLSIYRGEYEN